MAAGAAPDAVVVEEVAPVKLEFQNFGTSGEGAALDGRITKGGAAKPAAASFKPPPSDNLFSDKQSLLGGGAAQQSGSWNPMSLTTYQQYFDVDTADILNRLKKAVSPQNEKFFSDDMMKPDLYGPFWLCTTLIFCMAAAGNLGAMMSFVPTEEHQAFTYNFSKLTVATSVLYGYAGVVPLVGWAVSKWMFSAPFGLIELVCVYGYSLTIFIPASLLCVIPVEILRWIIIAGAFALSVKFITRNVKDVVMQQLDDKKALLVLLIVGGMHGCLAFLLKIYFYS
eukprot:CAMPEP_0206228284 /NCGR_PEP_ID=MMETSP0047_2-20121206/9089_1 /ASSEMBLY_ACC=CAM_ASM_000192 /TAXON_ID=195065 /ORGANISM="Chroomonas mesostigmatica_cf, Strain CCMP1168" /LENGTH=281 /DNA_ID=CAMNT_0053651521 /DNA_START=49 /DNA_END=894 /DNA_ORIENTATION=-